MVFLIDINLDERKIESLKRNLSTSFANGVIVAEIIQKKFPRSAMVNKSSFMETSSIKGRSENWAMLNQKTLPILRCELQQEDINKIVSREVSRDQILSFLRLLFTKLECYEPIYSSKLKKYPAVSEESLTSSEIDSKACPSKKKNEKILRAVKDRQIISRRASMM